MIKGLFALLVAGTLMVPHITPARGGEATVGFGTTRYGQSQLGTWAALPFPPVPHLDTNAMVELRLCSERSQGRCSI